MTTIPNCKGYYNKRKNTNTYALRIPLGWDNKALKYNFYYENFKSEPEAILAIKQINEYLYFGGVKNKKAIKIFRTQKEAEEQEAKEERLITFRDFANEVVELRKTQNTLCKSTLGGYNDVIKRVNPYLGDLPIASITTLDIDKMYQQMRSPTRNLNPSGCALSATTILKTHAVLRIILEQALDYDLIKKNPADKATKPKKDTKEKEALTLEQAQELYTTLTNLPYNSKTIGILIGLLCGTRISEMLALTWNDYQDETLHISKALEKDEQVTKCTKNGEERFVTCPPALVEILNQWQQEQKEYFKKLNVKWSKATPIAHSKFCTYSTQSNFRRYIRNHYQEWNLPRSFHYHELRHTYITLLFRDCATDEKTTRELSGHKSPTAFKIYTHTNEEWKRKATDKLSEIITKTSSNHTCETCKFWTASPCKEKGTCWFSNDGKITTAEFTCNNYNI